LVIGHRGAAALAPENTLAGLEAAVAAGADLVELDVDDGLLIGHPGVAATEELHLDDALAYLSTTAIGIHLDLKPIGAEAEIGAAVDRHGLASRVLVSSPSVRTVRSLAARAPAVARAISYPQDRHGISTIAWPAPLVAAAVVTVRPYAWARTARLLAVTRADALSLHHSLVTPAVIRHARSRGVAVIAWTVNDPGRVEQLARLGVDAVVSDDPKMAVHVLGTLNSL
jgi:glycerophosphoryl diester phosphodiesterase